MPVGRPFGIQCTRRSHLKQSEFCRPTGFYERHDLEIPAVLESRELIGEEKAAIEAIATALTIAADCAHPDPSRSGRSLAS
jgi:hypothetical protein